MLNLAVLTDLFHHMEWADAAVWKFALASEDAKADSKLRGCFYHLHMVQHAFLRIWRGESPQAPFPTFDDAPSLMQWARDYFPEAFAHLSTLSDAAISEPLPIPWAAMVERRLGKAPASTTVGETALQVVMHSQYHRGQVTARLRQIGVEPPLVDYIAWVWLGRPAPEWP
jgi:uncharacterized damage-inducible protein DinB